MCHYANLGAKVTKFDIFCHIKFVKENSKKS